MTKTGFQQRTSRFVGTSNAFNMLFMLQSVVTTNIFSVTAFALHKYEPQQFARFAPMSDIVFTVVCRASTLASDRYNIVEESDYKTTVLRQTRQWQLRADQNENKKMGEVIGNPQRMRTASDLELPRHTVTNQVPAAIAAMESALSRVSMVTAIVLIANELATGQSLPDQICSVMTKLMVWS